MKLIEAVINKFKLQEVRNALDDMGVVDFMESSIICHSQKGQVMIFRGAKFVANVVERVKLEIISADDSTEKIIEVISSVVKSENRDDCRIAIRPYLEVAC
jgi:nitrogen regulatory protein P-II 1